MRTHSRSQSRPRACLASTRLASTTPTHTLTNRCSSPRRAYSPLPSPFAAGRHLHRVRGGQHGAAHPRRRLDALLRGRGEHVAGEQAAQGQGRESERGSEGGGNLTRGGSGKRTHRQARLLTAALRRALRRTARFALSSPSQVGPVADPLLSNRANLRTGEGAAPARSLASSLVRLARLWLALARGARRAARRRRLTVLALSRLASSCAQASACRLASAPAACARSASWPRP